MDMKYIYIFKYLYIVNIDFSKLIKMILYSK